MRPIILLLLLNLCALTSLHAQTAILPSDTIKWDELKLFRLYKFKPVNGLEPADTLHGREVDTVNAVELDIVKVKMFLAGSLPVHKNGYRFMPLPTYAILIFSDGTATRLKFTDDGLWNRLTDIYYDVPKELAEQWRTFTQDARTVTYKFGDTGK